MKTPSPSLCLELKCRECVVEMSPRLSESLNSSSHFAASFPKHYTVFSPLLGILSVLNWAHLRICSQQSRWLSQCSAWTPLCLYVFLMIDLSIDFSSIDWFAFRIQEHVRLGSVHPELDCLQQTHFPRGHCRIPGRLDLGAHRGRQPLQGEPCSLALLLVSFFTKNL